MARARSTKLTDRQFVPARGDGVGLRRQAVMLWIRSGGQGGAAQLARTLRTRGMVVGADADGNPERIQVHATANMILKDVIEIRKRWREDDNYRWAKEEYRDRLEHLYARAYAVATGTESAPNTRIAALETCRRMIQQIGQLDGFWMREQAEPGESAVATLEVKELRVILRDREATPIETDAEVIG